MDKNFVEQIIDELKEDSCELYHKERSELEKITLLENMIQGSNELKIALKKQLLELQLK